MTTTAMPPTACRLCLRTDLHVHETDTRVREVSLPPMGWAFKPVKVTRFDFGLPAIKVAGRWWKVERGFAERLWPVWKKLKRLRARPIEQDSEGAQEDDEPYE